MALLEIKDIHAAYGKKEVLHGVSLSVEEGRIVAVLGPNGAGKSTLLKVIAGLLRPTRGSVIFAGEDITDMLAYKRVDEGIGYFMQGGRTFPDLTVEENLKVAGVDIDKREREKRVQEIKELFPVLQERWDMRAGLLSGGQKQQLALAITLINRPKLLLLDEPSAGMGPKIARDVFAKIKELHNRWQSSVLFWVEQNVGGALEVAERAIVLVNGEVAEDTDAPRELLESGKLERLFLGYVEESARNEMGAR